MIRLEWWAGYDAGNQGSDDFIFNEYRRHFIDIFCKTLKSKGHDSDYLVSGPKKIPEIKIIRTLAGMTGQFWQDT